MNEERPQQEPQANQPEQSPQSDCGCGCGCGCAPKGPGTKAKLLICLIVLIAAGAVFARGLIRKAESEPAQSQTGFATVIPAPAPSTATEQPKVANQVKSAAWGEPLKDLASLNQMAAEQDTVLLYLPDKARGADEAIKKQIEQAATKAQAGGAKTACFMLDAGSQDYVNVTKQVPAPCVLAMVKGGGVIPVTGDLSEGKLLEAIVTASRPPAGCGPSGCGTSGAAPSGCAPTGCAPAPVETK